MNLQNHPMQREAEQLGYYPQQEDIRRDPNYVLFLLVIIVGLFAAAMAYIFLFGEQLPMVE